MKIFKGSEYVGYEYKLITPKTKSSVRNLDVAQYVFDSIQTYIDNIVKNNYINNNLVFEDSSLIFVTNSCTIIDQSNLLKKWKSFLKKINVEYRKWHALRSACACLLFLSGADIKTVQEYLGHADINTTVKYYLRVFPEQKKNAIKEFNKKLIG